MSYFRAVRPDAESEWVLEQFRAKGRPRLDSFASPEETRAQFATNSKRFDLESVVMAGVVDHRIPDATGRDTMLLREYRPGTLPAGPAPAIVYLHGGGWVAGSPDTHDAICRLLADRARARVFSVDYRRPPEHRFPAPIDDCRAAWDWIGREAGQLGIDPARIAVAGDSAGGNLAAVLALEVRGTTQPKPCLQALIYPVTDASDTAPRDRATDEGYWLDHATMQWFIQSYISKASDVEHWRVSPMKADTLEGAPPAYIITCGYDVLGLQGAAYADRLRESGVPVTHVHYPGALHGYFNRAGLRSARAGVEATAAFLREALTVAPELPRSGRTP